MHTEADKPSRSGGEGKGGEGGDGGEGREGERREGEGGGQAVTERSDLGLGLGFLTLVCLKYFLCILMFASCMDYTIMFFFRRYLGLYFFCRVQNSIDNVSHAQQ